ncbi:MAG: translation initiation factor [Candidatus Omnitrophica bacterium]|nr:translation initiation factor [Candidatus Omnitrophota bacterium]
MIHIPDSIFPQNDKGERLCPACKKLLKDCDCPTFDPSQPKTENYQPRIRLDTAGRRGKAVTMITGLPPNESYLRRLTSKIKGQVGSGGTCFVSDDDGGVIEIQGDQRAKIERILSKEDFNF